MKKILVAVLFGGACVEHEISLISCKSVLLNLDESKYDKFPVYISKEGTWHKANVGEWLKGGKLKFNKNSMISPVLSMKNEGVFLEINKDKVDQKIKADVVFPVLHGTYGEDGTLQGLLELMNVPYVGAGVLGSSIGMDKIVMKEILRNGNISVAEFIGFNSKDWNDNKDGIIKQIIKKIGFPCFIKSADLGSSVGIKKIYSSKEIKSSVEYSLTFSNRVIVEKAVNNCREFEVSVLGNEKPIASLPGEIIPKKEFYDYEAKYYDNTTELKIPAELNKKNTEKLKKLSLKTYLLLHCSGMGRIDFLMDSKTEDIYVSEINTIPGFTDISMYPKLWEISGIPYKELLTKLIEFAEQRFNSKINVKTDFKDN
ncbi:MAG: D-alanine--D-alanine ligase family protein [Thermodesulfobacteriota bacterium]